ncbi:MAG: APC family permease, partial [bacterium]
EETGLFEDIAVYVKIFILLSLATLGIVFYDGDFSALNFFNKGYMSPVAGFAIIFVSYEGFQLITYDYNEIESVEHNLPRGMYLAILIAILIYVSVSFMATLQLTPQQLMAHEEVALAEAVSKIPYLEGAGFTLVILSALKSTSSGINATLFGASRLAHRVATEKDLPRVFSFRNSRGIPVYSLVIMGTITAIFTAVGSLKTITEFGSVAFLLADAAANYTGLITADETDANPLIPALGLGGTLIALPILIYHLYVHQVQILFYIGGIFLVVAILEFIYMERNELQEFIAIAQEDSNGTYE